MAWANPTVRHTTSPSRSCQDLSHTAPHSPFTRTSTRPSLGVGPPAIRMVDGKVGVGEGTAIYENVIDLIVVYLWPGVGSPAMRMVVGKVGVGE